MTPWMSLTTAANYRLSGALPSVSTCGGGSIGFQFDAENPFASLPACGASLDGFIYRITDASSCSTWGATVSSGGGSKHCTLECNGTDWTVMGQ